MGVLSKYVAKVIQMEEQVNAELCSPSTKGSQRKVKSLGRMEGKNKIHKGRMLRKGIHLLKSSRQRVIGTESESKGDRKQK